MKIRGIKPMQGEHVNVTPLIDVVMCLIIFFLLVGHIAKKASIKGIKIPSTATGKSIGSQSNELIINLVPRHSDVQGVQRRPRIYIWGSYYTYNNLASVLREYKSHHPSLKLIIRADMHTQYRYLAPVLVACAKAKIVSVHFMTRRQG
jgi:biopolymer transport protein ExbD